MKVIGIIEDNNITGKTYGLIEIPETEILTNNSKIIEKETYRAFNRYKKVQLKKATAYKNTKHK